MRKETIAEFIERNCEGERVKLNKYNLGCLQRITDKLRKTLYDNCMSHSLYRCTMTARENMVQLQIKGADLKGNLVELIVACDLETKEIYTDKIELENENVIADEIYNMILKIMETIPFTVGLYQFPIEGKFETGWESDYTFEKGTKLLYIEDSKDFDYFNEY